MSKRRLIPAALLVAITVGATGASLRAQDEVATRAEIAEALRSPNSGTRHDTWKRLNAEDSGHYKILLQVLKTKPWYDREGAIAALAKAFSPKILDSMVKSLKKDRDPAIRQGMAAALAKMNDDAYYPHLYEALDDKDPSVRRAVVHALRIRKKNDAVEALVQRFQKEEDPVVNTFIEQSLNELTQAFQGPNPTAWLQWWELAKNDASYELGKVDEQAKKAAEELGKKLKKSRTRLAGLDLDTAEKGGGEGVPIIVLPFYGYSREIMLPFFAELERTHRMIYVELPKVDTIPGLPGMAGRPFYPLDKFVEAFEALREERKEEHFAILACGMNSWIAMRYAQQHPDSVAAVVLVSPYVSNRAYGTATDRFIAEGKKNGDRELEYFGYTRTANRETGKSTLDANHEKDPVQYPRLEGEDACIARRSWGLHFADDRDHVLSMLFDVRVNHPGNVWIPDFDAFKEPKPSKRVPFLVFAGKASLQATAADCQTLAKNYDGICVLYANSADMPFAEEPERFNRDLAGFLKKYTRPRKPKS